MFHICLHICNICRIIYLTHVCLFSGNAQTCACNTYGVVYLSVLFVELKCFLLWIHYDVLRFHFFVYAQSKWFTSAHQMFYVCKSNDGMSHNESWQKKALSVHMDFILFIWFVYHSRPPTHIRKDRCNIYAPYICNIYAKHKSFCVMIYDSYMIAMWFYAINMRNTNVATYVLYMFTYAKFTRKCMWYVCVCSVAALQKQALHSSWI